MKGIDRPLAAGNSIPPARSSVRPLSSTTRPGAPTARTGRGYPIVLCDADRANSRRVERVLRTIASEIEIVESVEAARRLGGIGLLIVHYDALGAADRDSLLSAFPREGGTPRLFLHSGDTSRAELAGLFTRYRIGNLLARTEADGELLVVTIQKMLRGDIFGLEKYFPWGANFVTRTLRGSGGRLELISELGKAAQKAGVMPRFVDQMLIAADELTSNAIYDAPVDAAGRHRFASLPRSTAVDLKGGEEVTVTFGCDSRRLGLAVRDPFGSLPPESVLSYLAKSFRGGPDQIDTKAGGAGLGLYFAFEALSQLVVNVKPGAATEVIGLIDVRGTYRDYVLRGKSLNVFMSR